MLSRFTLCRLLFMPLPLIHILRHAIDATVIFAAAQRYLQPANVAAHSDAVYAADIFRLPPFRHYFRRADALVFRHCH